MSAAQHLLRQMQRDPRLAWLIGPGSRSYELITAEVADQTGTDLQELRDDVEAGLETQPWPRADGLTDEQIDTQLDAILRAGGAALRHYSMHKPREEMREALRADVKAAIGGAGG